MISVESWYMPYEVCKCGFTQVAYIWVRWQQQFKLSLYNSNVDSQMANLIRQYLSHCILTVANISKHR